MRVLFLQDHQETGGAARAANRFAAGLRKLGVEVGVAALGACADGSVADAAVGLGLGHAGSLLSDDVGARGAQKRGVLFIADECEREQADAGVVVREAAFLVVDAAVGLREFAQIRRAFFHGVGGRVFPRRLAEQRDER